MSDLRHDPDMPHGAQDFYNDKAQLAGVALVLLLVGGIIVAAFYSGNDTQVAGNSPAVETTGSASGVPALPERR